MEKEEQPEMQDILRELHRLSGFRLSVHDAKFQEIGAFPEAKSPYCRLVQSCEGGRGQCNENDRCAFEHVRQSPSVYLYRCRFGLYEAVAPLYILGNLVGYLMMGQTIDGRPGSREALVENALPFVRERAGFEAAGLERASLEAAAGEVCVCEKDRILSCMKILDICARYITLSNRFFLSRPDLPDKIKRFIDENWARKISIDDVCLRLFCSRTTATQAFREKYGTGIHEYLTYRRLGAAERLLGGTAKPIREVAERCGYADQNYFCRIFRKKHGLTPSEYRSRAAEAGMAPQRP